MPYKDPEKNKECKKKWREKNKEKIYKINKEYNQTEAGKKTKRISMWKHRGVISEDFESLYNFYINCENCEECKVRLTEDKRMTETTRCLDHDHDTGLFRNVICHSCNCKRR